MARYRPALALLGALSISSAQAAFDGNDVYEWCRTNRSMTLAYSAGIIDQNARVSYTLRITARTAVRVAVGTRITPRPPQSGRIEARIGLRMMPTFPRSSLSFRTAGFPQYGWKAGLSGETFPARHSA
jgi:hypothetical protein